jgi:hypothetical protein
MRLFGEAGKGAVGRLARKGPNQPLRPTFLLVAGAADGASLSAREAYLR